MMVEILQLMIELVADVQKLPIFSGNISAARRSCSQGNSLCTLDFLSRKLITPGWFAALMCMAGADGPGKERQRLGIKGRS